MDSEATHPVWPTVSISSTHAALVEEMCDMYIIGSRTRWLKDDVMSAFRVSTKRISPPAHCLQSYLTQVFHRLPDLKQPLQAHAAQAVELFGHLAEQSSLT